MHPRLKLGLVLFLAFSSMPLFALSPDQLYQQGYALGKSGDFAAALPLLRRSADAGYAPAQFTLGSMYSNRAGVDASKAEARVWFEKAAAQNHAQAPYNLGLYYHQGLGVAADPKLALRYYRLGALAGDGKAALPTTTAAPKAREMNGLQKGIIGAMEVVTQSTAALGSAGSASGGSYSGVSSYSPPSFAAPSGGYSIQDNADFKQFISSVSSYGQSVSCRPGNPYR